MVTCYDVIVVGAGHAGCEAALAAARMGCRTLLLTLNMENIALLACNPSIGGPGKGHLVREIDALGGEMAVVTDKTALQMRMLNTGKGPAVWALRAQVDKRRYQEEMKYTLENQANLDLKQALVEEILVKDGRAAGVKTQSGIVYRAGAVVLAAGVYLRGRIVVGDLVYPGGPNGQHPAVKLAENLRRLGLELDRFKTGTPPRIDKRTVDFSKMEPVPGDQKLQNFSFMSPVRSREQLPCWLTYTTAETHRIIRENLDRAPLFTGVIEGRGPRYCPSIEDKVVRFADKPRHQVFIEPEGRRTNELYVQGMSTSLPEDVQIKLLRSIPGLERVEIMRPAYAIEYDYVPPHQLYPSLETKILPRLFLAGQTIGTTGYEEAAALGLMAGINAARAVKGEEPFILSRAEAYIGVLIDDLVTKGVTEPYRIMTSRAEYRLLLRIDNADLRLTEKGYALGLVSEERYRHFCRKRDLIAQERKRLQETTVGPDERVNRILREKGSSPLETGTTLAALLARPELKYRDILELPGQHPDLPQEVTDEVQLQIKYEGYINKQLAEVERFKRLEEKKMPEDIDYRKIPGLSTEARERLEAVRPLTVGQASRVSGVSPADISVLLVWLERRRRSGT